MEYITHVETNKKNAVLDVYQIHQICDVLSLPQYAEEKPENSKRNTP